MLENFNMVENMLANSMKKLLSTIGTPHWFQGATFRSDGRGNPVLILLVNTKKPMNEYIKVPDKIDGISVKIIYQNKVRI